MQTPRPRLNVVGAGKLGQTLARLWHQSEHFSIGQLITRRVESAQRACEFVGAGSAAYSNDQTQLQAAQYWLIATPDDQIATAIGFLHERRCIRRGDCVFHCAGASGSDLLAPLRQLGALVASVHPAHSFAAPQTSLQQFAGSHCVAEGDPQALALLQPAFTAIGGHWLTLTGGNKALYHAATVMASNYVVTLMHTALQTAVAAGLSDAEARQLLTPLSQHSLGNALQQSAELALTGPLSRGDEKTIAQHCAALAAQPSQQPTGGLALYTALGIATLPIAQSQAIADAAKLRTIAQLLERLSGTQP